MGVFKGSLYILNFLCGLLPCEHKYPYPDTQPEPQAFTLRDSSDVNEANGGNKTDNLEEEMEDPLVVVTAYGKMKGYWMRIVGGRKIRAFEGIPYAMAPVNDLRFKAPLPVKPWTGILQADLKGPKCLQFNDIKLKRVIGSENCLFLNIYAKKPSSRKYPVIVYIHGGGFLSGSGNDFGPAYLLMSNLVLVTINYRLGVMGFLSTGDESSPGNYGLKDQSEAIVWVHTNIDKFGGDPNRIILLGHGSGASSIHFHMMSFKARGKFVGAISISGTAFNPWALHSKTEAHNLTKSFTKSLHCPVHGTSEDMVKCLRKQKGYDLAKNQIQFLDKWPVYLSLFRPVVEEEYQKEEPFISETPEEAYRRGTVDKVPWICGQAADEGYTFLLPHVAQGSFAELRRKWNEIAPDFFNYNNLPVDQDEITRRLNWLYFRHASPQTAPLKIYSDALGARLIHTGIHKGLQAHCRHAETYAFVFGFNGKYNLATAAGIKPNEWAVGHGEILGYILNSTDTYPGFQKNDTELVLSKILVNVIYNFAYKQKPGFTTTDGEDFHLWDRVTDPRNISFLRIDKNIKMVPEPYLQQTLYWESLGLPDSLPLANFSNEIEDLIEKDPKSKGFVSTVVTRQKEGVDIPPPELRPPPVGSKDNFFFTYRNVSFNNKTDPEVSFKFEIGKGIDITKISFTTEPPPEVSTMATTMTTTTRTMTPVPSPPRSLEPTSTSKPSSDKITRWFAQDYHVPKMAVAKRQETYTTTSTTTTRRPPTIPPTLPPRTTRPNNSGVLLGNLIDTVLRQNPLIGPYDKFQNSSRGISIPVVGDFDPHQNFVTRSNINMTIAYLRSIGNRTKEASLKSNESTSVDEMMLMDSNSI